MRIGREESAMWAADWLWADSRRTRVYARGREEEENGFLSGTGELRV